MAEESFIQVRNYDQRIASFGINRDGINPDLYSFIIFCAKSGNTNKPYFMDLAEGICRLHILILKQPGRIWTKQ